MSHKKRESNSSQEQSMYQDSKHVLKHIKQCPECSLEFTDKHCDIIFDRGAVQVIHVLCSNCSHKVVTLIASTSFGVSSLGMTTDLSAEDIIRISYKKPLKEVDILDFHTLLYKNQKKFIKLLSN